MGAGYLLCLKGIKYYKNKVFVIWVKIDYFKNRDVGSDGFQRVSEQLCCEGGMELTTREGMEHPRSGPPQRSEEDER